MRRDSKAFRERFLRWKAGEAVYDNGKPIEHYAYGEEGDKIYAPNGKYAITGQLYEDWRQQNLASRAAIEAAAKQPVLRPETRSRSELQRLHAQAAADRQRIREEQLKQKNDEAFWNLVNLTSPSTYIGQAIGQPITGAAALATDALTLGAAGALKSGVKAAAKAYAKRGFNTLNTPKSLLSDEPLIARGTSDVPYQIERYPGFMLRSLMEGNPLERLLSKTGTISVNSIRAHAAKTSEMEKSVINKILDSDAFVGQNTIDYNKFRKAVQDELITYQRVPLTIWLDYGLDRIGYGIDPNGPFPGDPLPKLNTFTFESPRIPKGSAKHYDDSTLGHSRTYTTPQEPDVLHVMESQSDWGQSGIENRKIDVSKFDRIKKSIQDDIEGLWDELRILDLKRSDPLIGDLEFLDLYNLREHARSILDDRMLDLSILQDKGYSTSQSRYLSNNYVSRQIQENLKYAAEHGQTKVRYPTLETAAKIEAYQKEPWAVDEHGSAINPNDFWNFERSASDPNAPIESFFDFPEGRGGFDYSPKIKTILKKYSDFPKQFKKLWKDQEVRTVADRKGNSWYEVDVPKDFLKREWIYGMAPWVIGGGLAIPKITE